MARRRNLNKYSGIFSECIAEKRKREEADKAKQQPKQEDSEEDQEAPK